MASTKITFLLVIYTGVSNMEDKRIRKTKKLLKDTLIKLLDSYSFEQITVTMLCDKADVSRITFYSHYADKFDLVEDVFQDMIKIGTDDYKNRERTLNPNGDIVAGFYNVLDSILSLYYDQYDFFKQTESTRNPYLSFTYYNHVFDIVEHHTNKESTKHHLKYTSRQITSFLCYGLLGFIDGSRSEDLSPDEIKESAHHLLGDMLNKGILF